MQFKNKKRKGFTIVEILIVVIIIGILAALVVPRMIDATKQAKLNSALGQHRTVVGQINVELASKPEIDLNGLKAQLKKAFDKFDETSGVLSTKNGDTKVEAGGTNGFKITTTSTEVTVPPADGVTTIEKP
ncbi:MAG: prepilin-type N-terminal cleavage/methylation domain-containing protein [Bacillota bacterium]|nr:prepilin-type N-terminal cleavage/methylation domain-containing protein [Bacillota bacterium]